MSRPEPTHRGPVFDLAAIDAEMRREDAYQREGHAARTLIREDDMRISCRRDERAGARIADMERTTRLRSTRSADTCD